MTTEWLPTLYKKTSTGADQQWKIGTEGNCIITEWGQVGGKIQFTRDYITKGKNLGKANATTPVQQARAEAQAQWEKKLKKGYVKSVNDARAGKVDKVIEGGVSPMLAHRFDEQGHKIVYPAFVQPKLDGHRCIAVVKNGKATLWSRTRKPITGVPHIVKDIEAWATRVNRLNIVLDGELYNHDFRARFEELTSFIRKPEPRPGHEVIQFHVYDIASEGTFADRHCILKAFSLGGSLVVVETFAVSDEDELMLAFEQFLAKGYEGLMVRNTAGLYVNTRSYDLQKIKEFMDAEFEVVGVEEGRGKLKGHAIFVCQTETGDKFRAKMKGETTALKQYWEKPELAVGKRLTVKFQGITKYYVPRFPVALRFREDV